jgi:hypothetical protein
MEIKSRKIEQQWDELETLKEWFISLYSDTTKVYEKPNNKDWSAFQLAKHLYQIEELILRSLKKHPMSESKVYLGASSIWRFILLKVSLWLPIKFKAPALSKVTNEAEDWEALLANWIEMRKELHKEIASIPADKYGYAMLKHPRAGYLNVVQTLSFLIDHFKHHRTQAIKLRK